MNNINEIKEDICRLRDPQNDGWIDKILIKLDELRPHLKTERDELDLKVYYKILDIAGEGKSVTSTTIVDILKKILKPTTNEKEMK